LTRRVGDATVDVGTVVRAHAAFVFRVLLHLGVPEGLLDDACQETFVIVTKQLPVFERRSSLETWLYGICRNVARATRRRIRESREVPTDELPDSVVQPAQEGELWMRRAHERLIWALSELREEQRTVFVLYELEELTLDEIAVSEGVALTTIHSRLGVARARVQALLRRRALSERSTGKEYLS